MALFFKLMPPVRGPFYFTFRGLFGDSREKKDGSRPVASAEQRLS
jgi:hypothetical protein